MADLTARMSVAAYREMLASKVSGAPTKRKNKYGNRRGIEFEGEKYDSAKELNHHKALRLAMSAASDSDRVIRIQRQVAFLLIPKQDGERPARYVADFVVDYADGRVEVHDTKSPPTRREPTYVLKRKLMLQVHKISIQEF